VTWAPRMLAPVGSLTVPVIDAVFCPNRLPETASNGRRSATIEVIACVPLFAGKEHLVRNGLPLRADLHQDESYQEPPLASISLFQASTCTYRAVCPSGEIAKL
jgi:hypothetical protein